MDKGHNIIQLTDCHLFADPGATMHGVNTRASLLATLDHILFQDVKPDMVVLSGDLAQDETAATYCYLFSTLDKKFDCPIAYVPGNHDASADVMGRLLLGMQKQNHLVNRLGDWEVILLDTQDTGQVSGMLHEQDLAFLDNCLHASTAEHIIIFMHHPAYSVGAAWLNEIMLKNAEDFLSRVSQDARVKLVSCGHVHQESLSTIGNVTFLSTPSTCFQFAASEQHAYDSVMPGYRWFTLHDNGVYETGVNRIEHDVRWIASQ